MTATSISYRVHDIPVLAVRPDPASANGRLALWLHYLGGTKEAMQPALGRLAHAGFTAVSLDAWRHGERADHTPSDLLTRVFANFRAEMWPILGRTVLDTVAVIDDAFTRFDLAPSSTTGTASVVAAGGVSMGGDVALTLAGIDRRITRVAAMIATPDWTRPGMTRLDDPIAVLDQGEPTTLGQWFYQQLDPMTHLERYRGRPVIGFDLGGEDHHIPRTNADAFRASLAELEPAAADRVHIRVHPGLDHLAAARDQHTQDDALGFLTECR